VSILRPGHAEEMSRDSDRSPNGEMVFGEMFMSSTGGYCIGVFSFESSSLAVLASLLPREGD